MTTRTESLGKSGAQWVGVLSQLPVGTNRTFSAKAFDSANTLLYSGQAANVAIEAGQTSVVTLMLQQVTAPPVFSNAAPVLTSLVANPGTVEPGGKVVLQATATDANTTDVLTYEWTTAAGYFSSASISSPVWTAPLVEGPVALTVKVKDSKGASTALSLTLTVGASTGQASVNVSLNTWPQVTGVLASPTAVEVGGNTEVTVSAHDGDSDSLIYQWTSTCTGTWANATSATAQFTPTAPPATGTSCLACTLNVKVTDGRGGQTTGSLAICVGPKVAARFPPQLVEFFQSTATIPDSGIVSFRVKATDAQSSALTFAWTANVGTLGTATTGANTSEVKWTAPSCVATGVNATITVSVTNALGLSAIKSFGVTGSTACVEPAPSKAPLAAGSTHSVALRNGTIQSWGRNADGQFGLGEPVLRQVQGLTGVTRLEGGYYHSIALKQNGTVWSWGSGPLGEGPNPRSVPGLVLGVSDVTALSSSDSHVLAVQQNGSVWAWGSGYYGQLGDGTTSSRDVPVLVTGITAVSAVAAGSDHSLAVKQDGTVWAWGDNSYGQLGDGTKTNRLVPVQVSGLMGVIAVAAGGDYSVALKQDGTVWTWGQNYYGQLGGGSYSGSSVPLQVSGLTGVSAVRAGSNFVLALKQDGTLWAWGSNSYGQLGDGTQDERRSPVQTQGLSLKVKSMVSGGSHSAAILEDGSVWAWGYNSQGQLGDGTNTARSTPTKVPGISGTLVGAGSSYTLVQKTDGTIWAWGHNEQGQLGVGSSSTRLAPAQMQGLSGVTAVASGSSHTVALRQDGTVWTCGRNDYGQLGDGTLNRRSAPIQVPSLSGITSVAASANQTFAVRQDGTVWAWGANDYGELGDGSTTRRMSPVQIPSLTGVVAISAQGNHTLALKQDGTVWAWGRNYNGELGDGTYTQRLVPVQVQGLSAVKAIAANYNQSLALRQDGTVWAWGLDFANVKQATPVQVQGIVGGIAIAAGYNHVVVAQLDGSLWAWGDNSSYQLGNGTSSYTKVTTPVRVKNLTGVTALAAGDNHTLGLRQDGTVWAWGSNSYGQVGGEPSYPYLPAQVPGLR
ncbi:RCC1 repeat-containing protein [Archangium violaceum]|uniref:RCC1 domain-containing protein n=1 Tax=Archangium violaceum TaxID=83451 RepID=UPI002B2C1EF2|nr:RCC1 repeat-containing protein [Archangium gephyra]